MEIEKLNGPTRVAETPNESAGQNKYTEILNANIQGLFENVFVLT